MRILLVKRIYILYYKHDITRKRGNVWENVPEGIKKSIDIDLKYPRNKLSSGFTNHRNERMEILDFSKIENWEA